MADGSLTFEEATEVFRDPLGLDREDERGYQDGPRFVLIGTTTEGTLLVVAYSEAKPNRIQIISARRATQHERRNYEDFG